VTIGTAYLIAAVPAIIGGITIVPVRAKHQSSLRIATWGENDAWPLP
jgi:hypothetical protein